MMPGGKNISISHHSALPTSRCLTDLKTLTLSLTLTVTDRHTCAHIDVILDVEIVVAQWACVLLDIFTHKNEKNKKKKRSIIWLETYRMENGAGETKKNVQTSKRVQERK